MVLYIYEIFNEKIKIFNKNFRYLLFEVTFC